MKTTRSRDGNNEIYVVNANGSNPSRLTHNPGDDGDPAWSPNPGDNRIAFYSSREDFFKEVYLMDAVSGDVSGVTPLVERGFNTPDPCVSGRANLPDGDVELVVLTSAASKWTFGTPIVKRGVLGAALTTSNRHVVALLVASDGNKFAGALSFDGPQCVRPESVVRRVRHRRASVPGLRRGQRV